MQLISDDAANQLLAGITIPPRPSVVGAIAEERDRDFPNLKRVSDLIAADVALAAAVLKLVNSPLYGLRRHISDIGQAVGVLGMANVATLVTGLVLRTNVPSLGLDRFWDSAARTAMIAAFLAKRLGCIAASDAHLFGLFRDCGIPLMLQRFSNYKDTLRLANAEAGRVFTEVEDACHATNHALVGSLLAANWKLSEDLRVAIRSHHELDAFQRGLSTQAMNLVAIGLIAEHIENGYSRLSSSCEWDKLGQATMGHLMLSADDLEELSKDAYAMLEETGS